MKIFRVLRIADIVSDSLDGRLSCRRRFVLWVWLRSSASNRELYGRIAARANGGESEDGGRERFARFMNFDEVLLRGGKPRLEYPVRKRVPLHRKFITAAAVLLPAAIILLLCMPFRQETKDTGFLRQYVHNSSSAVLILDDGSRIELNKELGAGRQVGSAVLKETGSGSTLSYANTENGKERAVNTLVIPMGTHYNIELSDGTKVYLDAGSQIEYPEYFGGNIRRVVLEGKAYFEVAHSPVPFVVNMPGSTVTVYGTEFCAEDDGDASTTTLVTGSVSVSAVQGGQEWILVPGQQARVREERCEIAEVETIYYTAWKDGYFMYESAPLEKIVYDLSRWYDVEFSFDSDKIKDINITARILKYDELEPVLDILTCLGSIGFGKSQTGGVIVFDI